METFKSSWRGWITSSDAYAVRLLGRTNLQYKDEFGELAISAEAMTKPYSHIAVYTTTIPDSEQRPRADVVEKLRRAFEARGWTMLVDGRDAE